MYSWRCKPKLLLRDLNFQFKIKNNKVAFNNVVLSARIFNCKVQYLSYKNINSFLLCKTYENYYTVRGINTCNTNFDGIDRKVIEEIYPPKKEVPKNIIESGPGLEYFIFNSSKLSRKLTKRELKQISHPYIPIEDLTGHGQNVFFEVHGCQMNVNDTEIAWSILQTHGYSLVHTLENAHIILIMTCAIREGAENKIWEKLKNLRYLKKNKKIKVKIGILGCMAERLKSELIEKEDSVDIIAGPDSYKDLPRLLAITESGEKSLNVLLSHDETYANIKPVSISSDKVSAFVSIMRGCDNLCTYCIVPYTRGRERSRDIKSVIEEIKYLSDQGIKEIVLLGQNVNSYRDTSEMNISIGSRIDNSILEDKHLAKGFQEKYKTKTGGRRFADLLDKVSLINPEIRVRFTSPHPKDFPDEVLHIINERSNICKCLHLPAQSGNSRILELMKRGYTREAYLELVLHIRSIIPNINLTSDFICGFCGETEEEFEDTLSLLKKVHYSFCYIFPYSMREKTAAHRTLGDTVLHDIKVDRVTRLHNLFREMALQLNLRQIGKRHLVLVEGFSRRSKLHLAGRNDGNVKVIIPDVEIIDTKTNEYRHAKPGDYVDVVVNSATSQTMIATPVKISSITQFFD